MCGPLWLVRRCNGDKRFGRVSPLGKKEGDSPDRNAYHLVVCLARHRGFR